MLCSSAHALASTVTPLLLDPCAVAAELLGSSPIDDTHCHHLKYYSQGWSAGASWALLGLYDRSLDTGPFERPAWLNNTFSKMCALL